jgi:hypothetical protein
MADFVSGLSGPEGDDAADRIVWRHANGHAITWNNFDPEAAHTAAQLCEHFVSRVALHPVKAARMNGHHGALHVDQIVFTQYLVLFAAAALRSAKVASGIAISVPQCVAASKSIIFNS